MRKSGIMMADRIGEMREGLWKVEGMDRMMN